MIFIYLIDLCMEMEQELNSYEKFVVGTYTKSNSDLLAEKAKITIRKDEFITLSISRGDYTVDGVSPEIRNYSLDKNGEIKNVEKMDKEDYKIYTELQNDIKKAVKKMEEIYSQLYGTL